MLSFRPLTTADFPMLLSWLSADHVKRWWNDGDDTLEKVAQHYDPSETGIHRFILVKSERESTRSIGYFQYYFVSPKTVGIDQFIGEAGEVNKGIGTKAIQLLLQRVVTKYRPQDIVIDPHPDNKRAIRCYEKVGFEHYSTKITESGKRAYLMRFDCQNAGFSR